MPEIARTADHALRILIELGQGEPLTPAELSERLDLNRTVTHRLLTTLAERGFVTRTGSGYRPGAALLRLGAVLEPDLRAAAAPVLARLSAEVEESLVVHIPDGTNAVVLEQVVHTGHVLQVSHQIGSRHPMITGASGRAMLAFQSKAEIERALKSVDHPAMAKRNLAAVAKAGFAASHDELQSGVHGIAVPILSQGAVLGSLAILVPSSRAVGLESHVSALQSGATEIATKTEAAQRK